jgi:hypothetical protein
LVSDAVDRNSVAPLAHRLVALSPRRAVRSSIGDIPFAEIAAYFGATGVYGDFIAGADASAQPTHTGAIKSITTKMEGSGIEGQAHVSPGAPLIVFKHLAPPAGQFQIVTGP